MQSLINMKKAMEAALESNDSGAVLELARESRKAFSTLIRLAYDKETLTGWRAIRAVGLVSRHYVKSDYDFLRDTIRKLLWSLSDESGGIGWSAPEMLGEIVSADPEKMRDIIPLIAEVFSIEEKVFRPGVLYALSRIAQASPESAAPFQELAASALSDGDPLARIHALKLILLLRGHLRPETVELISAGIRNLKKDRSEAWIFEDNGFHGTEVAEVVAEVETLISEEKKAW